MEKARPKHKRVFALLLAAIMLLSGCGISTPEPPAAELIGCVGDLPASLMLADAARWTLYAGKGEPVYFIDSYAKQNEHEDRARLMEYVMTKQYFDNDIAASPALTEKLRIMCEAIRVGFDTEGWTELPWERLLK